jgi:hypothetical protein
MFVSPLLAAYLVVVCVSLWVLAILLYLQDRPSPELHFTALMLVSVGAMALALASLVWMEVRFAGMTGKGLPAHRYTQSATGGAITRQ